MGFLARLLTYLLALVGAVVVVVGAGAYVYFNDEINAAKKFDSESVNVYMDMAQTLLKTGNAAEATVWRVPLEEGVTVSDAEEAMRSVANEHNIKNVGELPLYKQVEAMTGKPYRVVGIYMFCNPITATRMLDYSDAFSAYLPCRVAMVEDKQGKVWLYTLNMDMMIYGGTPLPAELKEEALGVKNIILDIMHRGAAGEF